MDVLLYRSKYFQIQCKGSIYYTIPSLYPSLWPKCAGFHDGRIQLWTSGYRGFWDIVRRTILMYPADDPLGFQNRFRTCPERDRIPFLMGRGKHPTKDWKSRVLKFSQLHIDSRLASIQNLSFFEVHNTYMYICIYIHTCIYTYSYIHIYVQSCLAFRWFWNQRNIRTLWDSDMFCGIRAFCDCSIPKPTVGLRHFRLESIGPPFKVWWLGGCCRQTRETWVYYGWSEEGRQGRAGF